MVGLGKKLGAKTTRRPACVRNLRIVNGRLQHVKRALSYSNHRFLERSFILQAILLIGFLILSRYSLTCAHAAYFTRCPARFNGQGGFY